METQAPKIKVGTYTLALGLIVLGAGLLCARLGHLRIDLLLRLWPLLLIGLGLEYFIRRMTAGERDMGASAVSLVLIGLLVISALGVNFYKNHAAAGFFRLGGGYQGWNWSWFGSQYTRKWQEKPFALPQGASLEVDNQMGQIELTPSTDGKIHLGASIVGRGSTLQQARENAALETVCVDTGSLTRIYTSPEYNSNNKVEVDMRIQIPPGLDIDVHEAMGVIAVNGGKAKSLTLDDKMGRIEAGDFTGDLSANDSMGEIDLSDINGDINAVDAMGKINIKNPAGNVNAHASMGSIYLTSDRPLVKQYVLQDDMGAITFQVPRSSSLRIHASTARGSISGLNAYSSIAGLNSQGDITLGGGQGNAQLENQNGAVRVDITG